MRRSVIKVRTVFKFLSPFLTLVFLAWYSGTLPAFSRSVDDTTRCPGRLLTLEEEAERQFDHIMAKQPGITDTWRYPYKFDMKDFKAAMVKLQAKAKATVFDVQVGGQCSRGRVDFIDIVIRESSPDGSSEGGSGFLVRSSSAYLTVCPVTDFFNGTYVAHCAVYGRCTNVSVLFKHQDFSYFTGLTQMIDKEIWTRGELCLGGSNQTPSQKPSQKEIRKPRQFIDVTRVRSRDAELKHFLASHPQPNPEILGEHGHWFQYKGDWTWLGIDGEVVPLQNNQTLCSCFKQFNTTYFLGASHMDINRNCAAGMCPKENIVFHLSRRREVIMSNLKRVLGDIERDPDPSHRYAIVIQLGSWDLYELSFGEAILDMMPKFHDDLQGVQPFSRRVRILVVSLPGVPDKHPKKKYFVTRNNVINAVFASKLRKAMNDLDIPFLDQFSFNLPLFWYVATWPWKNFNHHYSEWLPAQKYCRGRVGMAFLHLMTSKLCPGLDMY